ncbi:phage-related protein [Lactobacillus colini]|uniref:Phage-related protein n=1 Tax=Lactobacillus colini TaxID=1819254 RepID=A0ABS4MC96_9LACO|nr:hypothetical protein [Lactobacillus colini]MBP2057017.1 phage-related protein [Lactobacillus colini]
MQKLKIDGIDLGTIGMYISQTQVFNAPKNRFETISIPGRNGDLVTGEEAWDNIKVSYNCYVPKNAKQVIEYLKQLLFNTSGYVRIEDTINGDKFRLGFYDSGLDDISMSLNAIQASFTLTFNCKPQHFLRIGETWYDFLNKTSSGAVNQVRNLPIFSSPTTFPSSPIIKVLTNNQWGYFKIDDEKIEVANLHNKVLVIDTETLNCFDENGNLQNDCVKFSFNKSLKVNFNTAKTQCTDNISRIRVQPRWFTL